MTRCLNFTFRSKDKRCGEPHIDILPDEIMIHIFKYFEVEDLIKCELVCRRWKKIANDGSIWRRIPVVCSGQLGEVDPRIVDIIDNHPLSLRCLKIQYMLNFNFIKAATGKCPNLISLELMMCRLEKDFESLLKLWPKLEKLDLKNSLLKSDSDLVIEYDQFKHLTYLELSNFGLSASNCNTLLTSYNLINIHIDKIAGLTIEFIKLLISTKQETLEGLHIYGGNSIDDDVLFMLTKCPRLKELFITRCETLSDQALVAVSRLPKIKKLQLWNNATFSESMLVKTLKQPVLMKLNRLSLSKVTCVTKKVVDVICEYYKDLSFLGLYRCPTITDFEYEKRLKEKFGNIEVLLY